MDLFPSCTFSVWLAHGALVAGQRNEGLLDLTLPEAVARAERIDLVFQSLAIAGYGSGKSRYVVRRAMFTQPLRVEIPAGGLGPGQHRYPFVLDLPPSLPPAYAGNDCSIRHRIDLRLDVDWALDPTASFDLNVVPAAELRPSHRRPLTARSPDRFHDEIALELTVDSTVITRGEPLQGHIALRTGHRADFDAVVLTLYHRARVAMRHGDSRLRPSSKIHVPGDQLRAGQSVAFRFPTSELPPTQGTGFLDLSSLLEVSLDLSWWTSNRSFAIDIDVLPEGSQLLGAGAAPVALGGSRLALLAGDLASRTGLRVGQPPTLVYGRDGMVDLLVADGSRGSEFIALEIFEFPDLHLGLRSRPLGILPAGESLAPPEVSSRYAIKCEKSALPADAVRAMLASIFADLGAVDSIELSDHRLSISRRIGTDEPARWLAVVEEARRRARAIGEAIAALPFTDPDARAAWVSAASDEGAALLPHLPALAFVRRAARTVSGEQRELSCTLAVIDGSTRLDVHLDAALPAQAIPALHDEASSDELVRALRAAFPTIDAPSPQHIVATAPGFARDPRAALAALDPLFAWVLRARGERRMDAPYR